MKPKLRDWQPSWWGQITITLILIIVIFFTFQWWNNRSAEQTGFLTGTLYTPGARVEGYLVDKPEVHTGTRWLGPVPMGEHRFTILAIAKDEEGNGKSYYIVEGGKPGQYPIGAKIEFKINDDGEIEPPIEAK